MNTSNERSQKRLCELKKKGKQIQIRGKINEIENK